MVSLRLKDYTVNANEVTSIIFVYNSNNIVMPKKKFQPLMTHQIFEEEKIYGYHGLKIEIYYAAHSAYCFIDISYDDVVPVNEKFGLEADNLMALLERWFPNNIMTELEAFKACVNKDEKDYIYGHCVDCFMAKDEDDRMTGFRIIECDLTSPGFRTFHKRFQTLIIMFIDAANFIELDDPHWRILYLYEECRVSGRNRYCPVGFCTMYLFRRIMTFARISQFFIVPFLQKLGLGYRLLNATYAYLKENVKDLEDITVESPNAIFTRMRDNIDAALLIKEPCFKAEYVLKGYSDVMIHTARLKYKLSNKQARRVYEIIRYFYTKDTQDDYRKFIMDVKTHRKKQYMMEARKMCTNGYFTFPDNDVLCLSTENSVTLHQDFHKFINSVRVTIEYLEKKFRKQRNH